MGSVPLLVREIIVESYNIQSIVENDRTMCEHYTPTRLEMKFTV